MPPQGSPQVCGGIYAACHAFEQAFPLSVLCPLPAYGYFAVFSALSYTYPLAPFLIFPDRGAFFSCPLEAFFRASLCDRQHLRDLPDAVLLRVVKIEDRAVFFRKRSDTGENRRLFPTVAALPLRNIVRQFDRLVPSVVA